MLLMTCYMLPHPLHTLPPLPLDALRLFHPFHLVRLIRVTLSRLFLLTRVRRVRRVRFLQGYTAALNGLALSLTDGSPDNNLTEAFRYFNKSAAAGNADGLYNSALLLKDGKGVARDEAAALAYMRRAVDADHQVALSPPPVTRNPHPLTLHPPP